MFESTVVALTLQCAVATATPTEAQLTSMSIAATTGHHAALLGDTSNPFNWDTCENLAEAWQQGVDEYLNQQQDNTT